MSTRSGKRIHGSFHENTVTAETELAVKSERKTRSKRLKENCDELNVIPFKSKKKHNYVSYPSEDGEVGDSSVSNKVEVQNGRVSRKTALKEHNDIEPINADNSEESDNKKVTRHTRRTKTFAKETENTSENTENQEAPVEAIKKSKKNKKKKAKAQATNETEVVEPKKKSKKKKGKKSDSMVVEEIETVKNVLEKSSMSVESFHSAAGSPEKINEIEDHVEAVPEMLNTTVDKNSNLTEKKRRRSSIKNATFDDNNKSLTRISSTDLTGKVNTTFDCNVSLTNKGKKRKSTFDVVDCSSPIVTKEIYGTSEKTNDEITSSENVNTTYEKETQNTILPKESENVLNNSISRRKSNISVTSVSIDKINTTFEKETSTRKTRSKTFPTEILTSNDEPKNPVPSLDTTFEKETKNPKSKVSSIEMLTSDDELKISTLDTTFEKETNTRKTRSKSSPTEMLTSDDEPKTSTKSLDTTFEKQSSTRKTRSKCSPTEILTSDEEPKKSTQSLDATFDKNTKHNSTFDKNSKLDSTYDKIQNISSAKSSLISSDATSNLTFDKSDETSRISITSDDSRTENIINTTPVLIESSMDESQINESSKDKTPEAKPPVTPLKREGTFTKDSPDVIMMSPKPKTSMERTPTKRMSLPSPGNTPFPFSKSSQKEKCALNVTHSIEKAARRSSLAEVAPRLTRVMFCSPVDNPALATQQRRKVIKSSMKGSNKSFVFDDNASRMSPARPSGRKRSYTQTDADDALVKRKRLADDLQQSVDRLSRPRTLSAAAKLSEPSTPSKSTTPRPKSENKRTKLPNFAALHQRRFDKMESLDECQERKAKRAKQLLVPTGSVTVLERSSPKLTADAQKPTKTTSKTDTPTKSRPSALDTSKVKLPALDTSNVKVPSDTSKAKLPAINTTNAKLPTINTANAKLPTLDTSKAKQPTLPTLDTLKTGYTRFGFKMNMENNPFSIPSKKPEKKEEIKEVKLQRQATLPSLNGATVIRKEVAKQAVMREKSFTDRRDVKRKENRSIIKGVRTNRRFELQMKLRNIN